MPYPAPIVSPGETLTAEVANAVWAKLFAMAGHLTEDNVVQDASIPVDSVDGAMPLAGGTFTGDIAFADPSPTNPLKIDDADPSDMNTRLELLEETNIDFRFESYNVLVAVEGREVTYYWAGTNNTTGPEFNAPDGFTGLQVIPFWNRMGVAEGTLENGDTFYWLEASRDQDKVRFPGTHRVTTADTLFSLDYQLSLVWYRYGVLE